MLSTILRLLGYAVTGAMAGFFGGLLGIGGGIVAVPALNLIIGETMHVAIAGSLTSMVFVAAGAAWGHWKNGYLLRAVMIRLIPLAALSAVAGVLVGAHIPGWLLRRIFAIFLVYAVGNMLYKSTRSYFSKKAEEVPVTEFTPRNEWITPLIAIPMGFSSGVLGIGGGVIAVPAMHLFLRLPLKNAIANSAATIFFSSIIAATVKLISINGMTVNTSGGEEIILAWHHGAIIGVMLAPMAFLGGRMGSHIARVAPVMIIRLLFAAVALYGAQRYWVNSARPPAPPIIPVEAADEETDVSAARQRLRRDLFGRDSHTG